LPKWLRQRARLARTLQSGHANHPHDHVLNKELDVDEKQALSGMIAKSIGGVAQQRTMWASLHNATAFGAAILSAAAALTLKWKGLEADYQNNSAALLSALGATFGVIAATGGFSKKWRTCRIALQSLKELEVDMTSPTASLETMRQRYNAIWPAYNGGIIGDIDMK
jgi:hypothetical protein